MTSIFFVVLGFTLLCLHKSVVYASDHERRLYEDLMKNYDPLERPVKNSSQAVTVYLGVSLQQLIDVDEKNQILTINAWLEFTWNDYKLNWRPELYGGVRDVRFPKSMLWKPDVLLYNSVDSEFDSTFSTNMVLYHNGKINWIPPGIFQISCKIDITWFPFDEQHCYFKFGSWTYDGTKVDLQPSIAGLDMSEYLVNGEWNLYRTTVKRSEKFYECCPEPYPTIKFTMYMKRRTLYYGFNLIIPCILITLMTILGFTLPPESGEKIGLQITVLLSIFIFLSIVSDMSPPTSEATPLLGTFFSCCMFVVSASVAMTVFVLNLHYRASLRVMGDITRAVFVYWLPWLMRMNRPGHKITRADLPNPFKGNWRKLKEVEEGMINETNEQKLESDIIHCLCVNQQNMDTAQQAMLVMMHRVFCELTFITKRISDDKDAKEQLNEWRFAAMAIDRACLVLFTTFIFSSTIYIFCTAPYWTA